MTVRLAVVGAGGIAVEHLARLVRHPQAAVVGVADTDPEATASLAERVRRRLGQLAPAGAEDDATAAGMDLLRSAPTYRDARDLLSTEQVDALFAFLPPFAHGPVELSALAAGVALFVEKPVALDLGFAIEVAQEITARGLVSASGYQSRSSAVAPFLARTLGNLTIGMVLAHRFGRIPPRDWYRRQASSGGQVVEMTTHQVDLLRLLAGEIREVSSVGGRRLVTQEPEEIYDVQCTTLAFASGAVGSLANNLISAHGTPAHARGVHVFADDLTVSLVGHEGEVRTVHLVDRDGRREHTFDDDSLATQAGHFIRAVEEGRPDLVASDYRNGVATLAVTTAMHESARTGRPVSVRPTPGQVGIR